jgi:tripartite-type tricarboxylate transporter receptor subunit TctC
VDVKALRVVFAFAVTFIITSTGTAQPWPEKSISIVVPFSAGGPTDTLARIMSEPLRRFLGQTIIVDNITGAGGTIGVGRVVRSPPDGYTLSIGHWGTHVVNGAYYNLNYDLLKDMAPVAMIATNPQLITSTNAVPAKNLAELVAWIKANPQKMKFGTGGIGGASHISGVYFLNRLGVKTDYISYRGGAPAIQALMSGEIDLFITQIGGSITQVRAGKIRAYAVTSKNRQAAAPEIPSVDEAGLPGLHTAVWHGIWAPAKTPRDVVTKLNAAFVDTLSDANVRARFADLGQEIPPREEQTIQALAKYHKSEIDKWWPLIKATGLKAE